MTLHVTWYGGNMKQKSLFIILVCAIAGTIVRASGVKPFKVEYKGALKMIMHQGDLSSQIALKELKEKKALYALGAVENLKGEILIWDSRPFVSYVDRANVSIDRSFEKNAVLLVYTQVKKWKKIHIPAAVKSYKGLETFVEETARKNGIDTEKPFPFLMDGRIVNLQWHVIDWKEGDREHSHEKHKKAGLSGSRRGEEVEVVGFYSKKHHGIFTHFSTNMHLHFKTKDSKLSGHLDDLIIDGRVFLLLPSEK
jgi:acetolactate decarboxylase